MRRTAALLGLLSLVLASCSPVTLDDPEPTGGTTAPPIVGSAFQTFSNCDDLLSYYIEEAVEIVGPWGLGGMFWAFDTVAAEASEDRAGSGGGDGRSFTESNNQVVGVDELDTVKTDGNRIYSIASGALRIALVGDPGITMAGKVSFDWWPQGMLLEGNTVIVIGQVWSDQVSPISDRGIAPGYSHSIIRLVQIDVSDAANPRITRSPASTPSPS
jgi:hypothetical protein